MGSGIDNSDMDKTTGAELLVQSLKQQGVEYMFGVVGYPVIPIAFAAQQAGMTYIGMRNEQAASYAAQAAGYLTGRTQACLVVPGPGVVHALAGLANARANCWPMILIGGAPPTTTTGMGAFQEERQLEAAAQFCKYADTVEDAADIPSIVSKAVGIARSRRPGPVYLDMPDNIITKELDKGEARPVRPDDDMPEAILPNKHIEAALDLLASAKRPLVIVGKGMAWARAEQEVRQFIDRTRLPFLASPMGKGVVADDHPLSVGAARTHALKNADVVFLMGARLNWIMHFGLPPRFDKDVRVIQLDVAEEEMGRNVPAEVTLCGDGKAIITQLNEALDDKQWFYPEQTEWRTAIRENIEGNRRNVDAMADDDAIPMNYYRAFRDIRDWMPDDAIIVSEGANTMDIGRTRLPNKLPRSRLDAGTHGTMGVGLGFAIAAATVCPGRPVVAVEGDSAFGFSGMEVETLCRYNLPVKIIILNNNGIGVGAASLPRDKPPQPHLLTPGARYDKIIGAFGGKGFFVEDPAALRDALDQALAFQGPAIVNVMIDPAAVRKPQQFEWLTT